MFQKQPWMQRAGDHPVTDQAYFALLARAVFSAGLGPHVVEARWPGMVAAFRGFEPAAVAEMDEKDIESLLKNPEVIRNRRKIEAVVANARVFLDLCDEFGGFRRYLDSLGISQDLEGAASRLAERFHHLGPSSAALFLFSAGWRQKAACVCVNADTRS